MAAEISRNLMLVDDNRFDQIIVKRTVKYSQLFENITVFSCGQEALDHLKNNLDHPHMLPHLILLDIQMPEMDGFEFMEKFRLLDSSIIQHCKVAILSSTDDPYDIQRAEENPNIITLIRKPLHPETLAQIVKEFL